MNRHGWVDDFPGVVTVCDSRGTVLEMNRRAIEHYRDQGGAALVGTSLLDCHPGASRAKLQELLQSPRTNVYTIEKHGVHKLVCQVPWYADGEYQGLVELLLELPGPMAHFVRSG